MKRWFKSRTIWLNLLVGLGNAITVIAGLLVAVTPQALSLLPSLRLEPQQLLVWTIGLNLVVNLANIALRRTSPSAIGTADDVAAFDGAVDRDGGAAL